MGSASASDLDVALSERVVLKLVKPQGGRMDMEAVWAECSALQACSHPGIPQWLGIVNCGEKRGERASARASSSNQASAHSSNQAFVRGSNQASVRGSVFRCALVSLLFHPKPYFIVESLMPGRSLQHWLRQDAHAFTMGEIREIGLQLIDLLEHLEERGILHGDLRPANILYDGKRVSLIDFGLSERAPYALDSVFAGQPRFSDGGVCQESNADDEPLAGPSFFAPDRDGLASILLFLLYSDESRIKPGMQGAWREELDLSPALRQFLEDLFDENRFWASYAEVRKRFLASMIVA